MNATKGKTPPNSDRPASKRNKPMKPTKRY